MCSEETQIKVDEITTEIEKQDKVVNNINSKLEKSSSVKLGVNDEWKSFGKTALLKKFVDEEITLLDLRLKRMEIQSKEFSKQLLC